MIHSRRIMRPGIFFAKKCEKLKQNLWYLKINAYLCIVELRQQPTGRIPRTDKNKTK